MHDFQVKKREVFGRQMMSNVHRDHAQDEQKMSFLQHHRWYVLLHATAKDHVVGPSSIESMSHLQHPTYRSGQASVVVGFQSIRFDLHTPLMFLVSVHSGENLPQTLTAKPNERQVHVEQPKAPLSFHWKIFQPRSQINRFGEEEKPDANVAE